MQLLSVFFFSCMHGPLTVMNLLVVFISWIRVPKYRHNTLKPIPLHKISMLQPRSVVVVVDGKEKEPPTAESIRDISVM